MVDVSLIEHWPMSKERFFDIPRYNDKLQRVEYKNNKIFALWFSWHHLMRLSGILILDNQVNQDN